MKGKGLKIAVTGIFHETNTFVPAPTLEESFREHWLSGNDPIFDFYEGTTTTMGGVIDSAKAHGADLAAGLYTEAPPGGIISALTADVLLDAMIDSIDATADGLVLLLHGAMVAENYRDFEGECLRRVRERFGDKGHFPVILTLDLHANISRQMVQLSDVIIGYNTYPHVDMYECGVKAVELAIRLLREEMAPRQAHAHTGMLVVPQGMMTAEGSMKALMDRAFDMEMDDKVLNVTVAGGFPYSDVQDAGMSFVVTTDGDAELAERYANELKAFAIEQRESFNVSYCSPQAAIEQALAQPEGPAILAEGSDNVGGGGPADATHILKHLVDIPESTLMVICDAEAVQAAEAVGVGGEFSGYVGGKTDKLHGKPVLIQGKVRHLYDGIFHNVGAYRTGQQVDMGKTAVIQCGHLTLMLTTKRVPPFDLGHVRCVGLWPTDFKVIVVKSAVAWQAAFGAFAKQVIHVDTPGCSSANLLHFEYQYAGQPI
ncbi:M81 family metallopeptidase [Paenibacillus eucommiae]|uniref:Microcystin degradation protein MlrC n=1 Tax=Paenibacillus eucommiae TaxID=1355755 RepID=A0ABS4ILR9_9BACL|nr:M81 family metallopeptidase [Paenibacillus eucommiae]MBP1988518.1 microcystin degradation protein MlrC [Paenibacillus eucommiae]